MSHYITAIIGNRVVDFTSGTNHRTISAITDCGFDIYWLYNAFEYNNGMSGSGESVIVDLKCAKNAYKHAIAWALSLKQNYPREFQKEIEDILIFNKHFEKLFINEIFSKEELKKLTREKQELYDLLSEDEVERSIGLLTPVLEFSHSIYEGARNGDKVEISFC